MYALPERGATPAAVARGPFREPTTSGACGGAVPPGEPIHALGDRGRRAVADPDVLADRHRVLPPPAEEILASGVGPAVVGRDR